MKSIRDLRESAGMTQLQLADALGVGQGTVYLWERRKHEPRASQIKAIAEFFQVRMEEIDFEVGDNKDAPGG